MTGVLKNTLKGTRISFDKRGLNIFLRLRGANFKQHEKYSVIFFRLNTLKGTAIILTMVLLDFSPLNGTNLQILTLKRYDEQACHFYIGTTIDSDLFQYTFSCLSGQTVQLILDIYLVNSYKNLYNA